MANTVCMDLILRSVSRAVVFGETPGTVLGPFDFGEPSGTVGEPFDFGEPSGELSGEPSGAVEPILGEPRCHGFVADLAGDGVKTGFSMVVAGVPSVVFGASLSEPALEAAEEQSLNFRG